MIGDTIEVLFEDNHLLAVNKPAEMLTQASGTNQEALESFLRAEIKIRDHKEGNVFLHALHRLDKGASGVVLFAKSSKALSRMTQAIREKTTKKIYWALVEGVVNPEKGVLEHYLIHGDHRAEIVGAQHPQGKHSLLNYSKISESDRYTLLEIELITGRYHQIRAQWAEKGFPLIGDQKYGSKSVFKGIALHHRRLAFFHPITKEQMEVEAELPSSWKLQKKVD